MGKWSSCTLREREKIVCEVASQNGWKLSLRRVAQTQSVYLVFTHKTRSTVMIRFSNHKRNHRRYQDHRVFDVLVGTGEAGFKNVLAYLEKRKAVSHA